MQQHIHTIVKHFFQKDSLQEVPEQALQQFTEEHPYSSVGHWLLAKKLHQSSPADRYETQSARAATWFNNPLWLNWTLEDHEKTPETLIIPALSKEQPAIITQAPEIVLPEPETATEQSPEPEAIQAPEPEIVALAEIPAVEEPVAVITEEPEEELETEILIPGVSEPVSLVEPVKQVEEVIIDEEVTLDPVEEPEIEVTPPEIPELMAEAAEPAAETPAPAVEEKTPPRLPGSMLRLDEFKPVLSETEEPIFEPYHTIYYFASLGIKLRQEDLKDKLGVQLKSFTEWLRSMKRIAPTAMEMNANAFDEAMQQSIQEIAGHSVEGKEVLTEAMAHVWVKQGNMQKAIAIYEKLSLLNPVKSAYFAAQIEKLKAS
jgi:hypothetical protein